MNKEKQTGKKMIIVLEIGGTITTDQGTFTVEELQRNEDGSVTVKSPWPMTISQKDCKGHLDDFFTSIEDNLNGITSDEILQSAAEKVEKGMGLASNLLSSALHKVGDGIKKAGDVFKDKDPEDKQ